MQACLGGGKPQVQLAPRHFSEQTIGAPIPEQRQSLPAPGLHSTWLLGADTVLPLVGCGVGATDFTGGAAVLPVGFGLSGFPYQMFLTKRPIAVPGGFSGLATAVGFLALATGDDFAPQQSAADADTDSAAKEMASRMYFIFCFWGLGFVYLLTHKIGLRKLRPGRC